MTETITWLHISDTHFCREKNEERSEGIFDSFYNDLIRMRDEYHLYPDFIFFTGDVVLGHIDNSRGLSIKDQYEEAKVFLLRIQEIFCKLPISNILIVPGNHDVNRIFITPDQTEWLENLRKNKQQNGSQIINDLIKNNNLQWKRYMERLNDYKDFLSNNNYQHLLDDSDRLIHSNTYNVNGFKVGIACLNSAWSSHSSDEDKAKLWLGTYQILKARNKLKETNISIVISHHPPNWFTEFEDTSVNREIENNFNFYLHGHEHQEWVTPIDKHIRIASGALYSGSEQNNGYNFVRLYPSENWGEVFLRKYDSGTWIPNIRGNKTDNEGRWKLKNLNLNIDTPETSIVLDTGLNTNNILSDSLFKQLKVSMDVPQIKNYVGRYSEISDLHNLLEKNIIIIIEGIAGIGKTYLATRFAEELRDEYEVCWYSGLSESTSIGSLMNQISLFLFEKGRPTLYNSIKTLGYDFDNSFNIFKNELINKKYAFFFDNYHKASEKLNPLMRRLLDIRSSKIILITRINPTFYNILDKVENRIGQKTIDRWCYEDTREMFKSRGIIAEEGTIKEIHNRLQGYPQYLNLFCILALNSEPKELLVKLPTAERASHEYLEAEVYKSLNPSEKTLIKIASVYRIPENIEAFCINPSLSDIDEILDCLISKFLINKAGNDKYNVHEIISNYCLKDVSKRRTLRDYHLFAAQYYETKDDNPESLLEASYHYTEAGDNEKSALVIIRKAQSLVSKGFWEEVEKPLKSGIDTLSRHRDKAGAKKRMGYAHCLLADLYKERGDVVLAKKHLEQSEKAFMGKGDNDALYRYNNVSGHVYGEMGEVDKCEKSYQRCLELSGNDNSKKAIATGNLAGVHFKRANYEKALELHFETKVSLEELEDEYNLAVSYENIGICYHRMDDYDNAYICLTEAIKRFKDLGLTFRLNNARLYYAIISLDDTNNKEKLEITIQCLNNVLDAYSKMGHIRGVAFVCIKIAQAYDKLNNISNSIEYYQRARECYEKIEFSNLNTEDKILLVIVLMYLNDFDKAESIINDALKVVSEGNILSPILCLLLTVCLLYRNNQVQAIDKIKKLVNYCHKISYGCGKFDFSLLYILINRHGNEKFRLIGDIIPFLQKKTRYPIMRFEQVDIETEEIGNYADVFHPFIGHKIITKNDETLKIIISQLMSSEKEVNIDKDEVLEIERDTALMILGYLYKKGHIKVSELSFNNLRIGLSQNTRRTIRPIIK